MSKWFGPSALAVTPAGDVLYVAGERSSEVAVIDLRERKEVARFALRGPPTGVTLGNSGELIVTVGGAKAGVERLDAATGKVLRFWSAGSGVCAPVLLTHGQGICACERFADTVTLYSSERGTRMGSARAAREPLVAGLSASGEVLGVGTLLPNPEEGIGSLHAEALFFDAKTLTPRGRLQLPNGSTACRGLAFHPSRPICAVVHNVGRFQVPATQVEFGWMNIAALTLAQPDSAKPVCTVILDEARRGAANPSAVAWSPDGSFLCVAHAGTHELSIIDGPALLDKVAKLPGGAFVTDFGFLQGIWRRVALPDEGPRAVVIHGHTAEVAGSFSDSVTAVDLDKGRVLDTILLGERQSREPRREGERLFNDASICHQQWQSCASCHPDGRADGLNWDLLNDGIGNPKNTKSLLLAYSTPPAMSLGIRTSAEEAVGSGFRHILFAVPSPSQVQGVSEYLRALKPVPSPYLKRGKLSEAARRGKRMFDDPNVGCAVCHAGPLFTDLHSYAVFDGSLEKEKGRAFDTPTLVECWRTAPYLHDGSAATIQEVLTKCNKDERHGRTSHLSSRQISDLAAFVRSL